MNNLIKIFLVFLGSGLGGLFRYAMTHSINHSFYLFSYSISTILVNIIGSFGLGILFECIQIELVKHFLIIGFLGGFTTFSTYILENSLIIKQTGLSFQSISYFLLSNLISFLFFFLGLKLSTIFFH